MENKKEKKHQDRNHGRQHNQKMKPYLVMQYLLKNSDEQNPIKADKIVAELDVKYGIYAERRSIYRDIQAINEAFIMLEQGCDIAEAASILADDEYDEEKRIIYNKSKKGFYVKPRNYDANDIRLLAECVYSAKFLDKSQSDFLLDVVCELVSEKQAEKIRHGVLLTDRVKTNNAEVLNSISTINEAMSKEIDGEKHTPEKISFKYLKHTLSDAKNQVERRHGETYIASPFAMLINDGYYYLLAFDDKKKKLIHYRIDRMKGVKRIGEERNGSEAFAKVDMKDYTKRVFSMFGGRKEQIILQFNDHLLDAAIDRFGKKDVVYSKSGKNKFTVSAKVEISRQFFGWLLGFDREVKIISPQAVKEEFAKYIDGIRELY